MYRSLRCIALRTVRYDDRRSILTAWSDTQGRISIAVPAGDSREARRRRALMMPLAIFECECDIHGTRDIVTVRDVRPAAVTATIAANPLKATVALFLADVLDHALRQSQADPRLSAYLIDAILALDTLRHPVAIANYHLWFLYNLGRHLGIEPDTGAPGTVFDLREGIFRATAPAHTEYLEGTEAHLVRTLARLRPATLHHLRLTRPDRRRTLDQILRYYTLHYVRLDTLPSLPILRQTLL